MKRFVVLQILSLVLVVASLQSCVKASTSDTTRTSSTLPKEREELANKLEDLRGEHINMPPLPTNYEASRYINVSPQQITKEQLKGKLVLLDIWDYTCVNCIRTLPYIKEWNNKYKDKGLVIIGVHSPEFEFEKTPGNLDSAVKKFGLDYPIIADNDFEIWKSMANNYWPAKYLFDYNGKLRAAHFGEGEYQEFEAFIQKVLLEHDSTLSLPELTPHVRETDKPGAVCYRPTPETYVGFARSHYGNETTPNPNKPTTFTLPKELDRDQLYLSGSWVVKREYAYPEGNAPSSMVMSYQAKEVNLVIHPIGGADFKVEVEQDGRPVPNADRGIDLIEENGKTYLKIDGPRMYNIISNSTFNRFTLRLTSDSPKFGAYAFTFTTACRPPEEGE